MPKNNTTELSKEQAIANYQMANLKQGHKYQLLICAIVFTIMGIVAGYFVSIEITGDMRQNVISELQATALKAE